MNYKMMHVSYILYILFVKAGKTMKIVVKNVALIFLFMWNRDLFFVASLGTVYFYGYLLGMRRILQQLG